MHVAVLQVFDPAFPRSVPNLRADAPSSRAGDMKVLSVVILQIWYLFS